MDLLLFFFCLTTHFNDFFDFMIFVPYVLSFLKILLYIGVEK